MPAQNSLYNTGFCSLSVALPRNELYEQWLPDKVVSGTFDGFETLRRAHIWATLRAFNNRRVYEGPRGKDAISKRQSRPDWRECVKFLYLAACLIEGNAIDQRGPDPCSCDYIWTLAADDLAALRLSYEIKSRAPLTLREKLVDRSTDRNSNQNGSPAHPGTRNVGEDDKWVIRVKKTRNMGKAVQRYKEDLAKKKKAYGLKT